MHRPHLATGILARQPLCNSTSINAIVIRALAVILAVLALLQFSPTYAGKPDRTTSSGPSDTTSAPLALEYEQYIFRNLSGENDCLGEDDALRWQATGGLEPGESFTFTPQYPGCRYHAAAITLMLSWQGSRLELSSRVPDSDLTSWDPAQQDQLITAPSFGDRAQLCMFPAYRSEGLYYSVTVTNVGDTTADNIVLEGRSDNDWASNYYSRCLNADADHDGWNDSLEHSMADLLYPLGYIDGIYQPYLLWGSNYLKAAGDTAASDDEIDSNPADFNDDGRVDERDQEAIGWFLGEGNGIPLQAISPNPSDNAYYWNNVLQWRRYDLDGDGYVSDRDLAIVAALAGQPSPMQQDALAPSARILSPVEDSIIARGEYHRIRAHVWDNAAIARVDYLVDGQVICSKTDATPLPGNVSPFHACGWKVPKRAGNHELSVRVYDTSGNKSVSESIWISAQ